MVRDYISRAVKRKKYAKHDSKKITQALQKMADGETMVNVARHFDMQISSLQYYVRKFKGKDVKNGITRDSKTRIFSEDLEEELLSYVHEACDNYAGLDSKRIRSLAYDLAVENKLAIPKSWSDNKIAGKDWLHGYVKRHPTLSIRKPERSESTSQDQVLKFNETNLSNVVSFFDGLKELMSKYKFEDKDIYTMDEYGIITSHTPNRVFGCREQKQINAIINKNRGELVTFIATVSAIGNSIPPFFIFPRKRYNEDLIIKAPQGSEGAANKSGWMTKEIFSKYLIHFVKNTRCSELFPCLLLLDNQLSHTSVDNIKYAKANGIIMLTFPPCSHKLQPLDRSVFEPLKTAFNEAAANWITSNLGKVMKLKVVPELIAMDYTKIFSSQNIQSGFKVSGIYPLCSNIFTEHDTSSTPFTSNEKSRETEVVDEMGISKIEDVSASSLDKHVLPSDSTITSKVDSSKQNTKKSIEIEQ